MRPRLIAFLLSLNLSLATSDSERLHAHLFSRSDICAENNSVDCDFSCMPPGSVCCNDGSGTFCPSGTFCDSDGCCPIGEKCTGPGGTMTFDVLTGTGSLPTSPPKTTGHGGANYLPTLPALPSLTFGGEPVFPQATGAAPAGWGRGSELSALLLMAGQLVLG